MVHIGMVWLGSIVVGGVCHGFVCCCVCGFVLDSPVILFYCQPFQVSKMCAYEWDFTADLPERVRMVEKDTFLCG